MSDSPLSDLPEDLAALVAAERPLPPVPPALEAQLLARVRRSARPVWARPWPVALAVAVLAGGGWLVFRGRPPAERTDALVELTTDAPGRAKGPRPIRRPPVFNTAAAPALTASATSWFGQPDVPAAEIAGRVVRDGRGVAGLEVTLESQASAAAPALRRQTRSRDDGAFSFGRHPAGPYEVIAYAADSEPAHARIDLREPQPAVRPDRLTLTLVACRAVVSGIVSDLDTSAPLTGARVVVLPAGNRGRLVGPGTVTSSDGQYEICVVPGPILLRVEAAGHATTLIPLREEELERRDVQLMAEVVLRGRTVDATTGAPLAEVQVNAWPLGDDQPLPGPATTLSDAEGRFTLHGLQPHNRYTINAWRSDYIADRDLTVDVHPGPGAEVVRRLEPASRVAGVLRWRGQPVVGAHVYADRPPYARSFTSFSQAGGRFTLHGVPRGSDNLVVDGYRVLAPARLEVSAPEQRDVVVDVEPMRE